jgi:hypothetical protein
VFLEHLLQGGEDIGKLCCLIHESSNLLLHGRKQMFGDMAKVATDFFPEQAKLSLKGLQLGPDWGERRV